MEKKLELNNIPWGYDICFNENCQLREKCLHYQAYLLQPTDKVGGPAVWPSAWKDGQCQRFSEYKLVQKAWGFSKLYKNVPRHLKAEARQSINCYLGSGVSAYYRVHHGEKMLSPRQQQDIMGIMSKYGPTDGLAFDHYVLDYDYT